MSYLYHILAIAVAIAGVAFFSGSETSLVSSNRFRIKALARQGNRAAIRAYWMLQRPALLLSVTLVGTNILVVLASALATDVLMPTVGAYSVLVSTLSITGLLLVFGDIIPKAVARSKPESILMSSSLGLQLAYYTLYPIALLTSGVAKAFAKVSSGIQPQTSITREEIRALIKEATESSLALGPQVYAHRIMDLSRMRVTSVMVPMDEVECVEEEATVDEVLQVASRSGHSRYPVYRRTRENIVGLLHVKDLLGVGGKTRIKAFIRSAFFIPETQTVKMAIRLMREEPRHMAIVADEYGRPIGILTFEDLVEEIVGEIKDEYDRTMIPEIGFGKPLSGSLPVAIIRETLGIDIPEGNYETLAGFIVDRAGRMCQPGDVIKYDVYRFEVLEVKRRRIKSVRITKQDKDG